MPPQNLNPAPVQQTQASHKVDLSMSMGRQVSFTNKEPEKLISAVENEDEHLKKANAQAADKRLQYALEGRRQRKNNNQMNILLEEFKEYPYKWDIEKCVEMGNKIGMDRQQVSKWNWDHRKKEGIDTSRR